MGGVGRELAAGLQACRSCRRLWFTNPTRVLSAGEFDSHTAYALWEFGARPGAWMITPSAEPAWTMNATPLAAPAPLGGFMLTWPMIFAPVVEVVPVVDEAVLVPARGRAVEDCVEVPLAAAEALEVCLLEPPLLRTTSSTTTTTTTTIAPTSRKIAPPSRELGRSPGRGSRRSSDRRGRRSRAGCCSPAAGAACCSALVPSAGGLALARGPSGISGSGLLATVPSSDASTRAQARSYGESARRSRVCSATRSGSWPSR